MVSETIRVLLIDDDIEYTQLLRKILIPARMGPYRLTHAALLADALNLLASTHYDVILMDTFLQDSQGIETYRKVSQRAPYTPVIIMTTSNDEAVALDAVSLGAQDYLEKSQINSNLLNRSLRNAIERHNAQVELQQMTLVDTITGLYNYRGFQSLGTKFLQLAQRTSKQAALFIIDIENWKTIIRQSGLQEASRILSGIASQLQATFRESDVLARFDDGRFAVLAMDVFPESIQSIIQRLKANVHIHIVVDDVDYHYSIMVGTARYDPVTPFSLDELLAQAEVDEKRKKRVRE